MSATAPVVGRLIPHSHTSYRHTHTSGPGICLGHQGLGHVHGGKVVRAPTPMHGRLSRIVHTGKGIFAGIPQDFAVRTYVGFDNRIEWTH